MTISQFYSNINGDYEEVLSRLATDERIKKYVLKFENSDDYSQMMQAFSEKRYEDAFRFSHNLKGVSLNLGFSVLAKSSSALCETVRNGPPAEDNSALITEVTADYNRVMAEIANLKASA